MPSIQHINTLKTMQTDTHMLIMFIWELKNARIYRLKNRNSLPDRIILT